MDPPWSPPEPYVDPAADAGLGEVTPWSARIHVTPGPGWSPVTVLRATAPWRHTAGPEVAFLDEQPLVVTAICAPEAALPPAPAGTPLLSRLRMLHERFLPPLPHLPLTAEWTELGGTHAVLDWFSSRQGGYGVAFSIAADLGEGQGLVVVGAAPEDRHEALAEVAVPLAKRARPGSGGLDWQLPSSWTRREELQLVSDSAIAFARLEPLLPSWGLAEWTHEVFARAPFLRDLRSLGDRDVSVPGLTGARLSRFDWQPSGGQGRLLTSVVTALAGRDGFSLVLESPLETGEDFHTVSPDTVIAMLSVRPGEDDVAPAPAPSAPPSAGISTRPARTEAQRRLLARVDRTVVACVDIADGLWGARDREDAPAYDSTLDSADVAAVTRSVADLLADSGAEPVLARLSQWSRGARGFTPATSLRTPRRLLLGGGADSVDMLMATARFAADDADELLRRWSAVVEAGDASPTDAFWASAFLLTERAADPDGHDEPASLVADLDAALQRLREQPLGAWSRPLAGPGPDRPGRYVLRTFLDPGSGVLAWAGNDITRHRFDYPVEHEWLPISRPLSEAISELLAHYDEGSGLLRADSRVFTDDEEEAFRRSYLAVVDELTWQLGPAYQVWDESGFQPVEDADAGRERGPARRVRSARPDWLDRPGPLRLPSGRSVVVGEAEESWVTVELHHGVRLTIDDDRPHGFLVSLHRARGPLDGPPATRPYGAEVTVRYDATDGRLAVVPLPTGPHEDDSEHCDCREAAAFSAWLGGGRLLGVLDAIASMPVMDEPWDVRSREPLIWRGRLDDDARAVIEELPRDDRRWEDLRVAGTVDLP